MAEDHLASRLGDELRLQNGLATGAKDVAVIDTVREVPLFTTTLSEALSVERR